jgi:hypothetical protein
MGGVTQSIGKAIGMGPKKVVERVVDNALAEKENTKASRMDEEQGARMRGARRRGRQLLSDARLNEESGAQTLGGGQSLG